MSSGDILKCSRVLLIWLSLFSLAVFCRRSIVEIKLSPQLKFPPFSLARKKRRDGEGEWEQKTFELLSCVYVKAQLFRGEKAKWGEV